VSCPILENQQFGGVNVGSFFSEGRKQRRLPKLQLAPRVSAACAASVSARAEAFLRLRCLETGEPLERRGGGGPRPSEQPEAGGVGWRSLCGAATRPRGGAVGEEARAAWSF
jgi:hypothetical protein